MNLYTRKYLRIAGIIVFFSACFWFLYQVRSILIPFLLGFILAYILVPLVECLEKFRFSRGLAVILIYGLLLGLTVIVVFFVLPTLFKDFNEIIKIIPEYTQTIQNMFEYLQEEYSQFPIPISVRRATDETLIRFEEATISYIKNIGDILIGLFSQSFNLVLTPILGFYFLKEYNLFGDKILEFLPARYRADLISVGGEINQVIRRFIRGNLLVAAIVGIMTTLGMYLIGMKFPFLLGIMVGITNVIPYFGAIISAIFAFLLALLQSKWLALYVLALMTLIQQIESSIISPKILGDSVGLHPIIIIFVLLVGGKIWGVMGLLIAVPVAAILKILVKHIYYRLI